MASTTSSMAAIWSGEAWITRSGPSPTMFRSSSVTRQAISTMLWRGGSSPVISRSIQASIRRMLSAGPRGSARATLYCPAMLHVPLHQLDAELGVPGYARDGDAGADLVARTDVTLRRGGGRAVVPTGVAVAIPDGYAGLVLPRSGLAAGHGVTCLNAPGLVDSGYRGELKVVLVNHDPEQDYEVSRGDRIAQLVLVRTEQANFVLVPEEQLGESERGPGGFGHTGT